MIRRAIFTPWVVVVVSAVLFSACGDASQRPVASGGGTAVVCTDASPENLNPFATSDLGAAYLLPVLYTPLVLFDEAGGFRPHLAESWEWSPDQRAVRFRLREDVSWHDGAPVDAEAVAFTVRRAAVEEYAYFGMRDFETLEDVRVEGPHELEVRFREPYAAGLEPFALLPILPAHLLESLDAEDFRRAPYHREPIGSGPFRYAGRATDGSIRLERNEAFPAELGRPALERLVLRTIPEPTTMAIELETGGVHMCLATSSMAAELARSGRVRILPLEPVGVQGIPLDTRKPPFDDGRVREALSAALRRSEIAAVTSPLAQPARNLLPPSSPWHQPDHGQPDDQPQLAEALLDSAGWSMVGPDGIRRDASGLPLRFTLVAPRAFENTLVQVQAQWRRAGVDVELRFMEWAAYVGMIQQPDQRPDAMALGFFADKINTPDFQQTLSSDGALNLASYADPAVDSVIVRLRAALPAEERRALYAELQRRIASDVPIIYTIGVPRLAAVGPGLEGVNPDFNGPFGSIAEWRLTGEGRRRGS